jgi:hypothetical protein
MPADLKLTRVEFESNGAVRGAAPKDVVTGSGSKFGFDYSGPDTAIAINRLLKDGAHAAFDSPSHVSVTGVSRGRVEQVAKNYGLMVRASDVPKDARPTTNDQRPRPTTKCRSTPARRDVSALDRRQHGRRVDAVGAGAVSVQPVVDPQRRHPRRCA